MFSKLVLCVALTVVGGARLGSYGPPTGRFPSGGFRPQPGGGAGGFRPQPSGGSGGFRPQPSGGAGGFRPSGPHIPILRDDRQGPDELGNYSFNFETGDGISRHEQGAPQPPVGAVASQGGWSFTFPDGTPARFNFVADGDGYRVESDLIPTPPPLPPHAIAQIEKARREDANRPTSGSGSFSSRPGGGGRYQ